MNARTSSQRGSVVLVGLMLTVVLGIVLSSYIALSSSALRLSQREYQSSRALQLAENGMEEALWALNKYSQNNTTGLVDGTLDGAAIDWVLSSLTGTATATITGFPAEGVVTRKIGIRISHYKDPSAGASAWGSGTNYSVGNYANIGGIIYCCTTTNTGHSPAPATAVDWNVTSTYVVNDYVKRGGTLYRCRVANKGQTPENSGYWTPYWTTGQIINTEGLITLHDGAEVRRQLFAVTSPSRNFFPIALAAVNGGTISLSNFGGTIDSYDSTTAPYIPGSGLYSALVAGTTVDINSATVKGYTATTGTTVLSDPAGDILAPGETTGRNVAHMSINNSLLVPAVNAPTNPAPTVIHDWGSATMPISNSAWTPINSLSSPANTTTSYQVDTDLHLGNTGTLTINGTGTVQLIVPGNLFIGDASSINFYRSSGYVGGFNPGSEGITVSNGASLEIYVGGYFALYAGGITNLNNKPANVSIYSTTTSTAPVCDIRTNIPFYGTIYAPNGNFTIYKDAGIPSADFFGAVVAKNINLRGGASMHYDMALRNASNTSSNLPHCRSLILWRELANASESEFFSFNYP